MNIQEVLKLPEETRVKFSYNGGKFKVVKRGYYKCLMSIEAGYLIEDLYPLEEVVNAEFILVE